MLGASERGLRLHSLSGRRTPHASILANVSAPGGPAAPRRATLLRKCAGKLRSRSCGELAGQTRQISVAVSAASPDVEWQDSKPEKKGWKSLLHSKHDRDIVNLAVPALFSILLDPVMSLTDTALVGRLGAAQLAAVGLSGIAFTFLAVVFNFLLYVTTPAIAAAIAQDDRDKASSLTAMGFWIALASGIFLAVLLWFSAPFVVSRVLGADPEVTVHGVTYLRCRAVAFPALLGIFVATGSFRGHKDTRTPLLASVLSNIVNFGLDLFLMFVLGWGVAGAAIATSVSQYISFFILYWKLRSNNMLQRSHMRSPPRGREVRPLVMSGLALSMRSVVIMGTYVFATSLISSLGALTMAASEIMRQVFILSVQAFTALDISSQALVASYLGKGDRVMARDVLFRTLQLGVAAGLVIGCGIYSARHKLPHLFSSDPRVHAIAARALPLLAVFMPIDAIAAVMDGGLLGASDTDWVARASIAISLACLIGLFVAKKTFPNSLVALWAGMKMMTIARVVSGSIRYSMPGGKLSKV